MVGSLCDLVITQVSLLPFSLLGNNATHPFNEIKLKRFWIIYMIEGDVVANGGNL